MSITCTLEHVALAGLPVLPWRPQLLLVAGTVATQSELSGELGSNELRLTTSEAFRLVLSGVETAELVGTTSSISRYMDFAPVQFTLHLVGPDTVVQRLEEVALPGVRVRLFGQYYGSSGRLRLMEIDKVEGPS